MNMELDLEKNWTQFKDTLLLSRREGVEKLIAYLETTDIKEAPASIKFHLSVKGGLVKHSLNVYNFAQEINRLLGSGIDAEHIIISSLLHDLCKVSYYTVKQKWDADHKEATGQWRKMDYYAVDDRLALGHGEKSAIIALRYMPLTDEELLAIRWHMAFSDPATHFLYPSGSPFKEACTSHPLVKFIAMAEQMAECYETLAKKKESEKVDLPLFE